ncbi:hypothetical protein SGPA1_11555 [Streptomyces misionensis JCM 4497]
MHRPGERGLHDRVLRPDPRRVRLRGRQVRRDADPDGVRLRLRPHRLGHRQRPCGGGLHDGEAPLRRGQLLHQRQVDRRRRRPAALRRRPRLRHQRQGRCPPEPPALDADPRHQGGPGRPDRLHVPAHGLILAHPSDGPGSLPPSGLPGPFPMSRGVMTNGFTLHSPPPHSR